jgi:hypothetical protein
VAGFDVSWSTLTCQVRYVGLDVAGLDGVVVLLWVVTWQARTVGKAGS